MREDARPPVCPNCGAEVTDSRPAVIGHAGRNYAGGFECDSCRTTYYEPMPARAFALAWG